MDLNIHSHYLHINVARCFRALQKRNKPVSKKKEQLINPHSTDKLTDEMGTLGNTGQLRKVNSCCYIRLQFAENFKIPSLSQKHVHNYITTITANTKNK